MMMNYSSMPKDIWRCGFYQCKKNFYSPPQEEPQQFTIHAGFPHLMPHCLKTKNTFKMLLKETQFAVVTVSSVTKQ
jgi:hypothetical protein